jgi:hypothetical protein
MPYAYAGTLRNKGAQYSELGSASYLIPAVWFMFFNESDLVETEFSYVSFDGVEGIKRALLPCTTIDKARANIEASKAFFAELFNDSTNAIGYLEKTIEFFTQLEHEYLVLDASEYLLMNLQETEWDKFAKCFTRTNEAKKYIMEFCGYVDDKEPYDINEFYASPYHEDEERVMNSNALNPNFSDPAYRMTFPYKSRGNTEVPEEKQSRRWWQFWRH